ncbi:hypothetical protein RR46_06208 [Papilio xuthus]|uniref:Uncharacterized protein n=1 Tax=Papilio xuthus TaxID=66420 RepID=A0A194QDK8_PAPXU|nr:hypothetical protein RR46_06208 [Papilio xuthus]
MSGTCIISRPRPVAHCSCALRARLSRDAPAWSTKLIPKRRWCCCSSFGNNTSITHADEGPPMGSKLVGAATGRIYVLSSPSGAVHQDEWYWYYFADAARRSLRACALRARLEGAGGAGCAGVVDDVDTKASVVLLLKFHRRDGGILDISVTSKVLTLNRDMTTEQCNENNNFCGGGLGQTEVVNDDTFIPHG